MRDECVWLLDGIDTITSKLDNTFTAMKAACCATRVLVGSGVRAFLDAVLILGSCQSCTPALYSDCYISLLLWRCKDNISIAASDDPRVVASMPFMILAPHSWSKVLSRTRFISRDRKVYVRAAASMASTKPTVKVEIISDTVWCVLLSVVGVLVMLYNISYYKLLSNTDRCIEPNANVLPHARMQPLVLHGQAAAGEGDEAVQGSAGV